MSVARMSGPKLLDAALRTTQQPVDVEPVGVGGDLRCDPGRQPSERLGQRALHPEDALEGSEAYLHLLWRIGGRRSAFSVASSTPVSASSSPSSAPL